MDFCRTTASREPGVFRAVSGAGRRVEGGVFMPGAQGVYFQLVKAHSRAFFLRAPSCCGPLKIKTHLFVCSLYIYKAKNVRL